MLLITTFNCDLVGDEVGELMLERGMWRGLMIALGLTVGVGTSVFGATQSDAAPAVSCASGSACIWSNNNFTGSTAQITGGIAYGDCLDVFDMPFYNNYVESMDNQTNIEQVTWSNTNCTGFHFAVYAHTLGSESNWAGKSIGG